MFQGNFGQKSCIIIPALCKNFIGLFIKNFEPISARTTPALEGKSALQHSQIITTKKIPSHHLSVKEEKRQKKIEENKKTIEKVRESVVSDLDGLGEVERKALLKLRRKFALYNNTNYEVLDHRKMNFLHRGTDLKTKNLKIVDSEKFQKNRKIPTKILMSKI